MYKTVLPKKSASVSKDESMDSALTPYARYESNNSAKSEGRKSVKYFMRGELKRIFENLDQRFLLSNLDKTTADKHYFLIALSKANVSANDRQPIQTVQNRLAALFQEEEECDISKPTHHSFSTAWKLVTEASELRGKYFQKATVATDDEGGIRLRWRNPNKDREVRLYCPANTTKKMYIYHEEGDSYNAEFNVSGRTLAEWLYWLSDA
jgi:hypothetical protein